MARLSQIITEEDVKKLVRKWFDKCNAWSFAPVSRGMGVHGIPDRIGCVPVVVTQAMVGQTVGLFVAIEAKKPGRDNETNAGASALQVTQMEGIINAGGVAYVVDSPMDIECVDVIFDSLNNINTPWRERVLKIFNRRINKNG